MPGSFIDQREKKLRGTKVKRQNREGDAVGNHERVFSLVKNLQGNVQPSEGACESLLFTGGQDKPLSMS